MVVVIGYGFMAKNEKVKVTKGSGDNFTDIGSKNSEELKVKVKIALTINLIVKHRHTINHYVPSNR